jgi:uncharacterized protein (TIGR00251 family)
LIPLKQHANGVTFAVRVHPKARRNQISGILGDALKLELSAVPVEGRGNEACIRFFADFLKVPRASITIAAGVRSRKKVIRVTGISALAVESALATALDKGQ